MRVPRLCSRPSIFHPSTNRRMYRLASSGEIGEPCGMPRRLSRASVVRVFLPRSSVSSTAHSSQNLIRCSRRRSTIRRDTRLVARHGECSRRKPSHTTPLRDISSFVTILRERHPFEGRSLQVMGALKRRGVLLLLVVLPDGSRSLIPAGWTNWDAAGVAHELFASRCEQRAPCLASLADLLHARVIVDALLSRCLIPHREPAANEESCHATDPGLSRTVPASATIAEQKARRRNSRRGSQHSGTHHRASLRDNPTHGGDR